MLGGSRSSRWKWAAPRSLPVGALNGGWQTNTWAAMLTTQSGSRIWASASATVAVGPRMISSGVIIPPAVACLVGEQAAHDVGVLVVHRVEDPRALLAGHLAEQVGEVVVLHLVEHADEAVEVEALDEAELLVLGQLLEQVGEALVVHRRGELAALGQRQGAHDGGDLGRVQVAQAGGLGRHLARRREQPGHLVDVDEPVARAAAQRVAPDEADLGDLPAPGRAPSSTARRATSLTVSSPTLRSIRSRR